VKRVSLVCLVTEMPTEEGDVDIRVGGEQNDLLLKIGWATRWKLKLLHRQWEIT